MFPLRPKITPLVAQVIHSLTSQPDHWMACAYRLTHKEGTTIWIANEAYGLKVNDINVAWWERGPLHKAVRAWQFRATRLLEPTETSELIVPVPMEKMLPVLHACQTVDAHLAPGLGKLVKCDIEPLLAKHVFGEEFRQHDIKLGRDVAIRYDPQVQLSSLTKADPDITFDVTLTFSEKSKALLFKLSRI